MNPDSDRQSDLRNCTVGADISPGVQIRGGAFWEDPMTTLIH